MKSRRSLSSPPWLWVLFGIVLGVVGENPFLPHPQQLLGAPFKPSVGLSGIMALDLPFPDPFVREREADPGGNVRKKVLTQTL